MSEHVLLSHLWIRSLFVSGYDFYLIWLCMFVFWKLTVVNSELLLYKLLENSKGEYAIFKVKYIYRCWYFNDGSTVLYYELTFIVTIFKLVNEHVLLSHLWIRSWFVSEYDFYLIWLCMFLEIDCWQPQIIVI